MSTTCAFVINEPGCFLTTQLSVYNEISCNGGSDGALDLVVENAVGELNFVWSDPQIGNFQNPGGLIAGTYSVTVTDDLGCQSIATYLMEEPELLQINCEQLSGVTALGESDGVARIEINGGTSDYLLTWEGASTGSKTLSGNGTITELKAGQYNIMVTDGNECIDSCSFTITDPTCAVSAILSLGSEVSCFGGNDGSLELEVMNAQGELSYAWSDESIGNIQNPQELSAGTYTVTITDDTGCNAMASITIEDPTSIQVICEENSPVSANGLQDGVASISIDGGLPNYTIRLRGPINRTSVTTGDAILDGLAAGDYTVTITDEAGCTVECAFAIYSPGCSMMVDLNIVSEITCTESNDGAIEAAVLNSEGIITYNWDPVSIGNIMNPNNLPSGIYAVTVTDEAGCESSASIELVDPELISFTCIEMQGVSSIGASDGIAFVEVSDNNFPYTLSWNGPAEGSQLINEHTTIENLLAGEYDLTITNSIGCENTCTFIISEPGCNLIAELSILAELNCQGSNDGEILVSISGNAGSLQYQWNDENIGNTNNPTGLSTGIYNVTVTDSLGCTANTSIILDEPEPINLFCEEISPVSIPFASDGIARINLSGGEGPFQISWEGPVNGNTESSATVQIENLSPGNYKVHVVDQNNCEQFCDFSISGGECTLTAEVVIDQAILCTGDSNGILHVNIFNGKGPYQIQWNTGDLTNRIENLKAGTYTAQVIDSLGCEVLKTVQLAEPSSLAIDCQVLNGSTEIGSSDGEVLINILGGTPNYRISWKGPQSDFTLSSKSQILSNLPAGKYSVVVQDKNGCSQSCVFVVPGDCDGLRDLDGDGICNELDCAPNNPSLPGIPGEACNDQDSMTINDVIQEDSCGCAGTVTFDLDQDGTPDSLDCAILDPLLPGIPGALCDDGNPSTNGDIVLLDSCGCQGSTTSVCFEIMDRQLQMPSSCQVSDGQIELLVADFTESGLQFSIDGGSNWQVDPIFSNLSTGLYELDIVSNDQSCIEMVEIILNVENGEPAVIWAKKEPTECGASDGQISGSLLNDIQNVEYSILANEWQEELLFDSLESGVYHLVARVKESECIIASVDSIDLFTPGEPILDYIEVGPTTDCGTNQGSITVNLKNTSLKSSFIYAVDNGPWEISNTLQGLSTGSYEVKVRNANNPKCILVLDSIQIEEQAFLKTLPIVQSDPTACQESDGSISVLPSDPFIELSLDGGQSWSNFINQENLIAGDYQIQFRHSAGGCLGDTTVRLLAETTDFQVLAISSNDPSCFEGEDGKISTAAIGQNVRGYEFEWSNGKSTRVIENLTAGDYEVKVIGQDNCYKEETFTLNDPEEVVINMPFDEDTVFVCEGTGFQIDMDSSNLKYDWFFNDQWFSNAANQSLALRGNYEIVGSDQNGCEASDEFVLASTDEVFRPNFLLPSYGLIGDTIVVVEISWMIPDSVFWEISEDVQIIENNGNQVMLRFNDLGTYTIKLVGYSGDCYSVVEKSIEIVDDPSLIEKDQTTQQSFIKSFKVYPNPSSGNFTVEVLLNKASDLQMRIYDQNANLHYSDQSQNVIEYNHSVSLPNLTPGIYSVYLQTQNSYKSVNIIIKP